MRNYIYHLIPCKLSLSGRTACLESPLFSWHQGWPSHTGFTAHWKNCFTCTVLANEVAHRMLNVNHQKAIHSYHSTQMLAVVWLKEQPEFATCARLWNIVVFARHCVTRELLMIIDIYATFGIRERHLFSSDSLAYIDLPYVLLSLAALNRSPHFYCHEKNIKNENKWDGDDNLVL